MEQTVYGDILFFVNFCMDFQCLFLTAMLLRRRFPPWRAALFAALGALYACVALFLSVSGALAFLLDLAVCLLMCFCTFHKRGERAHRLLAPFLVYLGTSFAVGGVMSGIASLLSRAEINPGREANDLSVGGFFLLALLGGGLTFLWGRFCQRRANGRRAQLMLAFGEHQLSLCAMVDTANHLRDPTCGTLVALVSRDALTPFLPQELATLCQGSATFVERLPHELARRVRLVPASTATGEGLLYAISPDRCLLDEGRGAFEVALLVAPVELSRVDGIDCLLPAEVMIE